MTSIQNVVNDHVRAGVVPGAVALVADVRAGVTEVAVAGMRAVDGDVPMTRDTLFRLASITKPITAAATMALVERGRLGLDDPVSTWLPELAEPMVLRAPDAELDDVVAAERPITVRHLLTFTGGHGFPADFSLPVVAALTGELRQGPPDPPAVPAPEEWMARLSRIPLQHQPGERYLYNAQSDILGVLLARVEGTSLAEVLSDTLLSPLGMADTAFTTRDVTRTAAYHRRAGDGFLVIDEPDGRWASEPAFQSGAGGLVSTADDWAAFGRMLLADGVAPDGTAVLSPESVRLMTSPHVTAEPDNPFLQGQAWGYGGSVDTHVDESFHVLGRYGWVGGTGTAGYVVPSRGLVLVWLAQVELGGPEDTAAMDGFLRRAVTDR